ncbi:MAG: terpene cyclase/mutase family protein [Planctomycetes bacterium]|nr:terpene cyclase/mutase family protein [Planctomycetota bacterium]
MSWQTSLIKRLTSNVTPSGAWSYHPGTAGYSEPTALACLALSAQGRDATLTTQGLSWLAAIQRVDGAVPICASMPSPCWPTPIALLAWLGAPESCRSSFETACVQSARWLTKTKGRPIAQNSRFFGHDTTLIGWPWIEGTHSWIEPTALAILALDTAGHANHERVREGLRVIENRALAAGGWNYGNTRVLNSTLRPFCSMTGLALMALAGRPPSANVEGAIAFLKSELPTVRSAISLSWGLLGLTAWDERPNGAGDWLAEAADRQSRLADRSMPASPNAHHDALLLLADAGWHPTEKPALAGAKGYGA